MTTQDHTNDTLPDELQGVSDRLDRLALEDRAAAPPDLTARLAQLGVETEPPSVIARIGVASRTFRAAAAIGVVALAGVGAVLMTRPSPAPINSSDIVADGTAVLDGLYSDDERIGSEADPFWSIAIGNETSSVSRSASLWDMGDDAFDDAWAWPDGEESL